MAQSTANIGTEATKVNAAKYQIMIKDTLSTTDEWLFLQDANLTLSHPEQPEPYTSGTITYYSGAPRNRLTGTILYTSDMFVAWTPGTPPTTGSYATWPALYTKTNGEFPLFTLIVKETDKNSGTNTMTFTSGAKMESLSINKAVEGAVKVTISIILTIDPTIT